MTLTANFEAGTLSNTIATGDAGSADAWTTVVIGAGCTVIYDNTHAYGTLAAKLTTGGNAMRLRWTHASNTDQYGRIYLWLDALPGAGSYLNIINLYNGANICAIVRINDAGKLLYIDNPVNVSGTSTNALSTGQWVRLEWHLVNSFTVGSIETKIFNSPDSTTATETFTWSNRNTYSSATEVFFGMGFDGQDSPDYWLDNIVAQDTAYPGPSSAIKTVNTLAKASIKTLNTLAIASVKTRDGLA